MKMSGGATICCVVLFLALTSVSAIQWLNSINDLKEIDFGQSVPKHSLVLLYWFANTVEINANNHICLTFDPNNGDYGSHHYGNFEGLLDPLTQRHQYYTVGNIYQNSSVELPSYVVNYRTENMERNMARIIIRVRGLNAGLRSHRIDQVYITQHFETSVYEGTRYDQQHTYGISTNLLREIRELSLAHNQGSLTQLRNRYPGQIDHFKLNNIRESWGTLAGLGLLLLIVIQKEHYSNQVNFRPQSRQNHWYANAANAAFLIFIIVLVVVVVVLFVLPNLTKMDRW